MPLRSKSSIDKPKEEQPIVFKNAEQLNRAVGNYIMSNIDRIAEEYMWDIIPYYESVGYITCMDEAMDEYVFTGDENTRRCMNATKEERDKLRKDSKDKKQN